MIDASQNPYQHLYVYYFKGRIRTDYSGFGGAFIGNWEEDGFSFLFFSKPSDDSIHQLLNSHAGLELIDQYDMTFDQWHGGRIKPERIAKFILTPPWEKIDSDEHGIPIRIDPGVVFGTGKHPTTCDCLEMLCSICDSEPIQSVSDLGAGTGVLAIAAVLLGSRTALAVDFNFLAAQTSKKNAILNQVEDRILVIQGNALDAVSIPSDLLIANIHYDIMEKLIRSDGFLNHNCFILSGLLRSQAKQVSDMIRRLPLEVLEERNQDGIWHSFLLKRIT